VDFIFEEGVGHKLIPIYISIESKGSGDRGAKVHRGFSQVLQYNQRICCIVERHSCRLVSSANSMVINSYSGLWGLGNRDLGFRQFLNNSSSWYSRRLACRCSCNRNGTGSQKYRGWWVFKNSTGRVNRCVSSRSGQPVCLRNCLRIYILSRMRWRYGDNDSSLSGGDGST
jgi:hypothetical protein